MAFATAAPVHPSVRLFVTAAATTCSTQKIVMMKLNLFSSNSKNRQRRRRRRKRKKEDPTRLGDDLFIVCFRVADRSVVGCACCC
jgi:hypothetical protein